MRALRLDSVDLGKDAAPTTSNMRRTISQTCVKTARADGSVDAGKGRSFHSVKQREFWSPDPELSSPVRHEKQPSEDERRCSSSPEDGACQ